MQVLDILTFLSNTIIETPEPALDLRPSRLILYLPSSVDTPNDQSGHQTPSDSGCDSRYIISAVEAHEREG